MANPFPFVAGTVLTAAEMNGIGEATTFTPTWTNLTVGNAVQDFKYTRVNNLVMVTGKITLGSTSSITGSVSMNLPITADTACVGSLVGTVNLSDASVGIYPGVGLIETSGAVTFVSVAANGTYLGIVAVLSSTVPFTWVSTDAIRINFVYKAA